MKRRAAGVNGAAFCTLSLAVATTEKRLVPRAVAQSAKLFHFMAVFFPVPDNAAEPDMAGRRIDRLRMARGRPVAAAIVRCAEVRAALEHLAGNPDLRLAGIVALVFPAAAGVLRNATGLLRVGLVA